MTVGVLVVSFVSVCRFSWVVRLVSWVSCWDVVVSLFMVSFGCSCNRRRRVR